MPIEIKELHIRVEVNPQQQGQAGQAGSAAPSAPAPPIDQEALIAECVERVLQILQNKKER
jgi:hypothetical protein